MSQEMHALALSAVALLFFGCGLMEQSATSDAQPGSDVDTASTELSDGVGEPTLFGSDRFTAFLFRLEIQSMGLVGWYQYEADWLDEEDPVTWNQGEGTRDFDNLPPEMSRRVDFVARYEFERSVVYATSKQSWSRLLEVWSTYNGSDPAFSFPAVESMMTDDSGLRWGCENTDPTWIGGYDFDRTFGGTVSEETARMVLSTLNGSCELKGLEATFGGVVVLVIPYSYDTNYHHAEWLVLALPAVK